MPPFFGKLYHNSNTISNYFHTFGDLRYLTSSHSKVFKVSIINLNIAKNSKNLFIINYLFNFSSIFKVFIKIYFSPSNNSTLFLLYFISYIFSMYL